MFFALDSVAKIPSYLAVLLAIAWGIAVLGLGRWFVGFRRQDAKWKYFVLLGLRLLLALALAFVVAVPVILRVFEPSIATQAAAIQRQQAAADLARQRSSLNRQLTIESAAVNSALTATALTGSSHSHAAITRLEAQRNKAADRRHYSQASYFQAQLKVNVRKLSAPNDKVVPVAVAALSATQQQLSSVRNQQAALASLSTQQNVSNASLPLKLQALNSLSADNGAVNSARLLMFALFVLVVCLPLALKFQLVMQPGNSYEQAIAIRVRTQAWPTGRVRLRRNASVSASLPGPLAVAGNVLATGTRDSSLGSGGSAEDQRRERDPYEDAEPVRHLSAELPERAPAGRPISLLVQITLAEPDGTSVSLKGFTVPAEGRKITIIVSAPHLIAMGDLEQDLYVPATADSELIRFSFRTGKAGLHPVRVRAFAGGTCLGDLTLQISVEVGAALEEGVGHTATLGGLVAEPGEVTLQVSRTEDDRYSFQLIADALYPVELTKRLAGDPTEVVTALVDELRAMAARSSQFTSPKLVRNRLRNLGVQLWADAVPKAIRDQFWDMADRIKLFTVASDMDAVPWELLYPEDGSNDNGFLVEQFPVVRRVYGQGRARQLPLASAAYIVPPGSPDNAMNEVQAVRSQLGASINDRGVVQRLDEIIELLESSPSVLHFACHNQFTDQSGSVIKLEGGPLRPSDLASAVQKHGLAAASPLVFLNACRTAGETPGLTQMMGWAKQFMGAGAGAFLGSLWAVRSSSAQAFADAFYHALITERAPLGAASLQARQTIAEDGGDPTWLAYTVYGNPSATVGE